MLNLQPAFRVEPEMRRATPSASTSLASQLTRFCLERGISKKDIAETLGTSPSYLAQMVARGMNAETIERLTAAMRKIDGSRLRKLRPHDFDRYVWLCVNQVVDQAPELIEIMRRRIFTWNEEEKSAWTRMSLSIEPKPEPHSPSREVRKRK